MANINIKIMQYSRIVEKFAKMNNISYSDALGFFYNSKVYELLDKEAGDYHVQGDLYICEDLLAEYNNKDIV